MSTPLQIVNELLDNDVRVVSHQLVLGITITGPDSMSTHEHIHELLNHLPEKAGRVTLHDVRVLRGMLDPDDVPLPVNDPTYDKVR